MVDGLESVQLHMIQLVTVMNNVKKRETEETEETKILRILAKLFLVPKLIKNVNFDRFEMDNVIEWWRKKAQRRFETLKKDGRYRTKQEIWDINEVRKEFDIIR